MSKARLGISAELSAELAAALGAFTIHSVFTFSFADEPPIDARMVPQSWAGPWASASAEPTEAERLPKAIQATLYERCYARRLGGPAAAPLAPTAVADPEFVHRLSQANAGRERWDKGWIIHQLGPNGQVFVRKGDRERAAMPGAFISEAVIGLAPQIGASVSIRAPRETLDMQPGYYFTFGETLEELADQLSLVRLYFHSSAEGAIRLLAELSPGLNAFQVPFQLKMPVSPASYGRTDAAVLYIGARYFPITARIVAQVREKLLLEPDVPLFTKRLWPGVAAAVEPGSGESFGMHRCRLAAEGMVDAWRQGSQGAPAQLAAVAARFAAAGLDLGRPYLGPCGIDLFDLPVAARLP